MTSINSEHCTHLQLLRLSLEVKSCEVKISIFEPDVENTAEETVLPSIPCIDQETGVIEFTTHPIFNVCLLCQNLEGVPNYEQIQSLLKSHKAKISSNKTKRSNFKTTKKTNQKKISFRSQQDINASFIDEDNDPESHISSVYAHGSATSSRNSTRNKQMSKQENSMLIENSNLSSFYGSGSDNSDDSLNQPIRTTSFNEDDEESKDNVSTHQNEAKIKELTESNTSHIIEIKELQTKLEAMTLDLEKSKKSLETTNLDLEQSKKTLEATNLELEQSKKTLEATNRELEQSKKTLDVKQSEWTTKFQEINTSWEKLQFQTQLDKKQIELLEDRTRSQTNELNEFKVNFMLEMTNVKNSVCTTLETQLRQGQDQTALLLQRQAENFEKMHAEQHQATKTHIVEKMTEMNEKSALVDFKMNEERFQLKIEVLEKKIQEMQILYDILQQKTRKETEELSLKYQQETESFINSKNLEYEVRVIELDSTLTELRDRFASKESELKLQLQKINEYESERNDAVALLEIRELQYKNERTHRQKIQLNYEAICGGIRIFARIRPFKSKELSKLSVSTPISLASLASSAINITTVSSWQQNSSTTSVSKMIRLCNNECVLEVNDPQSDLLGNNSDQWRKYYFSHIFHPGLDKKVRNDSQSDVFEECLMCANLAMRGMNTVIITCGQPGSGKLYTMLGKAPSVSNDFKQDDVGLIPRMINLLFKLRKDFSSKYEYRFVVSAYEIYNGHLDDLLWKHERVGEDKKYKTKEQANNAPNKPDLKIKISTNGELRVTNATLLDYGDAGALTKCIDRAISLRRTRKTATNRTSVRSHVVVSILIKRTDMITKSNKFGKLSFAILAPTERIDKGIFVHKNNNGTNATTLTPTATSNSSSSSSNSSSKSLSTSNFFDERLAIATEAKHINESIMMLNNVLRAVGKQQQLHYQNYSNSGNTAVVPSSSTMALKSVSTTSNSNEVMTTTAKLEQTESIPDIVQYRGNILTYLLQDSIGGPNAKSLLILNIHPSDDKVTENIDTLRLSESVQPIQFQKSRFQHLETDINRHSMAFNSR